MLHVMSMLMTSDASIIFRAFQGIGGAGLYSLAMTVMTEITPLKHIGVTSGLMGAVFASSSILGPLLGGVISSKTTWRWVFFLKCVSLRTLPSYPHRLADQSFELS